MQIGLDRGVMRPVCIAAFLLAFATPARAAPLADVPAAPDPSKTYLIYLHGQIIENLGPRPTHPRFGLYDYPAVLDALASRGAVVVSAQRSAGTDPREYAGVVVEQVKHLMRSGVPPAHIAVAGFSKGGDIAIRASALLRQPLLRYVLLGACWSRPDAPEFRLTGRVFSVRETSDTVAGMSCEPLSGRSETFESFEEIAISTGRSHGAFYVPLKAWLDPVLEWVHGERMPP